MAFSESRGFLLVVILTLTLGHGNHSKFVFPVSTCPSCEEDWKRKSNEFKCDANKTLSYHCILDSKDQLMETCMTKTFIPPESEGCPRVVVHTDGLPYHDFVLSDCLTNNTYCPRNHTGYWTDNLYKYPICFQKESNRNLYQGYDCQRHRTVRTGRSNETHGGSYADSTAVSIVTTVLSTLVIAVILIVLVRIIGRKRNGEGPSDEHTDLVSNQISEHMDLVKFILSDTAYHVENLDRHLVSTDTSCEYCKKMDPMLFAAELSLRRSFTYLAEKLNFKFRDNEMAMRILGCSIRNNWIDLVKKIMDSHPADAEELNATVLPDKKGSIVFMTKEMKNVLLNLKEMEICTIDDLESSEKWQEVQREGQHIRTLIFMS